MKKFAAWTITFLLCVAVLASQKTPENTTDAVTSCTTLDKENQSEKNKEKQAVIEFDSTTIDLGIIPEEDPVAQCTFKFKNTGDAPLIINQALASCGCTIPTFTLVPIRPGEEGQIDVTYDGSGKLPGHFKKTITVRTNASQPVTKLYIKGEMIAAQQTIQE